MQTSYKTILRSDDGSGDQRSSCYLSVHATKYMEHLKMLHGLIFSNALKRNPDMHGTP